MRTAAVFLIWVSVGHQQPPERLNVILIVSDDQRWDALGAAGSRAVVTPVLDRMAADGIYFRQATTHASVCGPSRATLLTGLPTFRHGWLSNQVQNPGANAPDGFKDLPTLPGLLRDAGYRTALVGKWHITPDPWQCGFSEVRTWFLGAGGPYQNPRLARGNSRKTEVVRGFINEIFADDAVAFVKAAPPEKPFFLWLAFTAPHGPCHPNPERISKIYEGKGLAELVPPGFPADIPVNDWRHYNEAVSLLDEQVGRVLGALNDAKLADRTVVAFVSDNGYMMGSRGIGAEGNDGKFVPYEESIRVPLIVQAPDLKVKGPTETPVSSLDLPPTLLSLAGVKAPKEWPGRDFSPVLRGEKHGLEDAVSVWAANHGSSYNDAYRVLRTAKHKLIAWEKPDRPDELYDLSGDPRETKNLIDQAPDIRDALRRRLRAWMERTADPALGWKK